MSVALFCTLRKWRGVSQKLNTKGRGSLHAANPANRGVPPMRVLGSATIPVVWAPEDKVHNLAVRVVDELPYGLIAGARFFRTNNSVLDFGVGKGFKPTPSSCWIPFAVRSMNPVISPLTWDRFCALTNSRDAEVENTPPPFPPTAFPAAWSHISTDNIAWENDNTLQWEVRLVTDHQVNASVRLPGFVSTALEGFATGPLPQDRQLVIILPLEKYDMDLGAIVGIAWRISGGNQAHQSTAN